MTITRTDVITRMAGVFTVWAVIAGAVIVSVA